MTTTCSGLGGANRGVEDCHKGARASGFIIVCGPAAGMYVPKYGGLGRTYGPPEKGCGGTVSHRFAI